MRALRTSVAIAAAASAAIVSLLACGDSNLSAMFEPGGPVDGGARTDAGFGAPEDEDHGSASGVVVVHAASFPAFRLCFSGYPELPPQPELAVMPEANVVGVEVGSVVRIPPFERAPGKVYVIAQRKVSAGPADVTKSCGELLDPAQGELFAINDYNEAGELTEPLGVTNVAVLAITGCGGLGFIAPLGVPQDECGPSYDTSYGGLAAKTLALVPSGAATAESLPVQVVHLSTTLEAHRATGEVVDVTFGAFDDTSTTPLAQAVVREPQLFEPTPAVRLTLDEDGEAMYGTHGFRIALRATDGGADATVAVDQSLAEIQQLSAAQALPTSYYATASSYALLLLGDPRITPTHADGGANDRYDPRRAVHLLAVPVKEPTDGGDAPTTRDAGESLDDAGKSSQ
ncbi:MAG: hypothetical protein KF850_25250 [Labilithrix sp.]|nr:hypothetical protein [Labilithrix sp.]